MRRHVNPHRIIDDQNMFEVCENSSHPELNDSNRVYHFRGYTFKTATECEKYFKDYGLDPKRYSYVTHREPDGYKGKMTIHIFIAERVPLDERQSMYNYEELFKQYG